MLRFLAFALLLTSCHSTRVTEFGVVEARCAQDHEKVEQVLSVLVPQVREALDSPRSELPRVRVLRSERARYGHLATCYPHRIDVGASAMPVLYRVMAHELTHWYARGTAYAALPAFLEEGLAEYVAELLVPHAGVVPAVLVESWSRADWYEDEAWSQLREDERRWLIEIGFQAVVRLGLDRLHELAQAQAPATDYLLAAGLLRESSDQ